MSLTTVTTTSSSPISTDELLSALRLLVANNSLLSETISSNSTVGVVHETDRSKLFKEADSDPAESSLPIVKMAYGPERKIVNTTNLAIASTGRRRGNFSDTKTRLVTYLGLQPMPERYRCVMRFNKEFSMVDVGSVYSNVRFEPSYAYDVDPVIGSSAMPFFAELGAMYRLYRVNKVTWKVSFSNSDVLNCTVWVCPVNTDPGVNTSLYQNYLSNPRSKKMNLSVQSGTSTATLRGSFSVSDFGGASNDLTTDSYVGTTQGAVPPTNNIWLAVGNLCSLAQVNGVWVSIDMNIELDFFEYLSPIS